MKHKEVHGDDRCYIDPHPPAQAVPVFTGVGYTAVNTAGSELSSGSN